MYEAFTDNELANCGPGTGHDDMLKSVDLPIVSNKKCREMHRGNLLITSSKICAGGRRNEGVCEVKKMFKKRR